MKRLMIATLCVAVLALAGCASSPTAPTQTPAQIAAIACPEIEATIAQLQPLYAAQPPMAKQAAQLAAIEPKVQAACKLASITNLQELATALFPRVLSLVQSPPLTPTQVEAIDIGVVAAQVALQAYGAPKLAPPAK